MIMKEWLNTLGLPAETIPDRVKLACLATMALVALALLRGFFLSLYAVLLWDDRTAAAMLEMAALPAVIAASGTLALYALCRRSE